MGLTLFGANFQFDRNFSLHGVHALYWQLATSFVEVLLAWNVSVSPAYSCRLEDLWQLPVVAHMTRHAPERAPLLLRVESVIGWWSVSHLSYCTVALFLNSYFSNKLACVWICDFLTVFVCAPNNRLFRMSVIVNCSAIIIVCCFIFDYSINV